MGKGHKQKLLEIKNFIDRSHDMLKNAGDQERAAIGKVCTLFGEILNEELKEYPDFNLLCIKRDEAVEIINNLNTYHAIDQIRNSYL
jgi:hypothetical protein